MEIENQNLFSDLNSLLTEIDNVFTHHNTCGFLYDRYQRIKADLSLSENSDLESIYRCVESHVPGLRKKITLHYEKLQNKALNNEPCDINTCVKTLKSSVNVKCENAINKDIAEMLRKVQEMPKEWTIIHLTPRYNCKEDYSLDPQEHVTNPIHISVFNCGDPDSVPFSVTTGVPANSQIVSEVLLLLKEFYSNSKSLPKGHFKNVKEKMAYKERKLYLENGLKNLVKDAQNMWLKEWRCLLTGKLLDGNIEKKILEEINDFFKKRSYTVSNKTKDILRYATKGVSYLTVKELKAVVQHALGDNKVTTLIKEVGSFIRSLYEKLCQEHSKERRHPIVLVVHESLDCIPWEMIDVLKNQPVTRMPSFHLLYFLYKVHENQIENGYKIISDFKNGSYVVNPDKNLPDMEIRMKNFFKYWIPSWSGASGYRPSPDEYSGYLNKSEIFSYHGHGDGFQILGSDKLEKCDVKAVVLLFGCSSTQVQKLSPQIEMYAKYYTYLLARCPCLVGMLWNVPDADTDILTAEFLSRWVPSEATIPWKYINKDNWSHANQNSPKEKTVYVETDDEHSEPDLLTALYLAKQELKYYHTKAACVVRGLPVKIKKN